MLGGRPILGRMPGEGDEERTVVISHALWTTWFGGDSAVVGRTYDIASQKREIIGVMGPDFRFPDDETLLWITDEIRPTGITPGRFGAPLVARLAPGATPEQV